MKIAVVCEPGQGGVKRYIIEQVFPALSLLGENATYIFSRCRVDSDYLDHVETLKKTGVKCIEVSIKDKIHLIGDFWSFIKIILILLREKPKIVHTHSSKAGAVGRAAAAIIGIRSIHSPHGLASDRSSILLVLEKILSQITFKFVAVSEGERERIRRELGVSLNRIELHNPYIKRLSSVQLASSPKVFRVVSCGRLCADKNPLAFLGVAEKICSERDDVQFIWIGDGSDAVAQNFKDRLAKSRFREKIILTGWIADPAEVMRCCQMLMMLSLNESFCYVVADGITMGIPCILSPVSGLKDYLHEFGEMCFPAEDVDAASSVLMREIDRRRQGADAVFYGSTVERFLEKHSATKCLASLSNIWWLASRSR